MTKVLFVAYQNDPRDPIAGSGADYQFYTALCEQDFEVEILGPVDPPIHPIEKAIRKVHGLMSNAGYWRYPISKVWATSRAANKAERRTQPDVVFSLYPRVLAYYRGNTPCVFRTDVTSRAWQRDGTHQRGGVAQRMDLLHEERAIARAASVITHSTWCGDSFIKDYGLLPSQVVVFPNPAALPSHVVPPALDVRKEKELGGPLRLLLVGRDFERKGIDIAIATVHLLNERDVPARLTVCGLERPDEKYVQYAGFLDKRDPQALERYADLYRAAHLMLFPVRFDFSPIVTSEAAAFGVPTITNDVGGVSTSVKHGASGLVLPRASGPEAYAEAIVKLVSNPEAYYGLCQRTRARYEGELNWDVASQKLAAAVRQVARVGKG